MRHRPHYVLVGYGTRAGSTREVAERIAGVLRSHQLRTDVLSVNDVEDPTTYTAFVIGSCVYSGSWTPQTLDFVRRHRQAIARRPVWLFSVGAFTDTHPLIGGLITREPREIEEVKAAVRPLGYRVFAGVINPAQCSALGRLVHHAFGGRDGDNRDWPEIDAWGNLIAGLLSRRQTVRPPTRTPFLRSVAATRDERQRTRAGDHMIASCGTSVTHGVTIHAGARAVWPWLVQMGAGSRAGWYSYDRLDNGGVASADRIVPALQTISVGTLFPAAPGATDGFHVLQCEAPRHLVLGWIGRDRQPVVTWSFTLRRLGRGRTRLIVRVRAAAGYSFFGLPSWVSRPLGRAVHFVMQRQQLLGIARRAESQAAIPHTVKEAA